MTVVTGWDLFEDLREAQDEFLRLNRQRSQVFGQLGQSHYGGATKAAWMPSVDISERKDAYLVAVELPGVRMDNLEITFRDGLMTIQGERFDMHDSAEEKVHRVEHRYGPFLRSIIMPSHVMAEAIEASAQDGVLQILVPKAPEVQARRIQVHASRKQVEPALEAEAGTSG
jgi:HSP20 family protein